MRSSVKSKELIIQQFKTMDRAEIEQLVKDYARAHPGEKGLDEILGINGHRWAWYWWNGAVFTGDDANDVELARMGVPQTPKQKGEVALRVMNQQITQSTWLGQWLAGEEYGHLVENANKLRTQMGITDADIDERGYIRETDPVTGQHVRLGNFDTDGNFVPLHGAQFSAFEKAVAFARVSADNYKEAVDRISNAVATAIVVVVAIATTIATGGAGASIWIPVLVTALAGLGAMGFKMAMKGGRYGRDEAVRDLVSTAVQAATAGMGAAAGVLLRGGPLALKALATSWRMSEELLAKAAGQTAMLRALSLAEDIAINAGTSALGGAATTALDPAMRRRDDYGDQVWGSFLRGALTGAVSSAATRGVMGASTKVARALGARSGARAAFDRGASEKVAARLGSLRSRAFSNSALTEIGGRALATGTAGALSRAVELKFEEVYFNRRFSGREYLTEMAQSFAQGFVQGAGEAAGDRLARRFISGRAAEHAFTQRDDARDFRHRGAEAAREEAKRRGLIGGEGTNEPASARPRASPIGPQPSVETRSRTTADLAAPVRAPISDTSAIAETAATRLPPTPTIEDGSGLPQRTGTGAEAPENAQFARPTPTLGVDEHGAAVPAPHIGAEPEPASTSPRRTGEAGPEEAPILRTEDKGEGPSRTLTPANDNPGGTTHQRVALSDTDMVTMPKAMEGSVFVHPDSRNLMAANDNFGRLINADPTREVAIHHNPVTGEYVVIQGATGSVAVIRPGGELTGPGANGRLVTAGGVPDPGGHWIVHSHFHPNRPGQPGTAFIRRLPSGFAGGDFGVVHFEVVGLGHERRSSRIYFSDQGRVAYTDFGIDPGHPKGAYWIDYPDPSTGKRVREHFETPGDYGKFLKGVRDNPELAGSGGTPTLRTADAEAPPAAPPRALAPGSRETAMTAEDHGSVQALVDHIEALTDNRRILGVLAERGASQNLMGEARKWVGELEANSRSMIHGLGLVGEPQSMTRLHLIMNDPGLSIPLRQAIADTVLEATRAHLVATGQLSPDEPLMLLFHGAPDKRTRSIRSGGIDMARIQGGSADDFGRGLYLTSRVEAAVTYVNKPKPSAGEIFPFVLRGRDVGVTVDVSPGGTHRAAWEAFIMSNLEMYAKVRPIGPVDLQAWMEGRLRFGQVDAFENRGVVFEAFLADLARQTGRPELARPDFVHGELGGPMTSGYGRGDQQAVRTTRVADVLNDQLGFRRSAPVEGNEGPILRTADEPEGPKPPKAEPELDEKLGPKPMPEPQLAEEKQRPTKPTPRRRSRKPSRRRSRRPSRPSLPSNRLTRTRHWRGFVRAVGLWPSMRSRPSPA